MCAVKKDVMKEDLAGPPRTPPRPPAWASWPWGRRWAPPDARLNLRVMHVALGTAFIVLTVLMLKVQIGRFYREDKGPGDWVAWLHFVIFAFLLFLAARMLRRWAGPAPVCAAPRGPGERGCPQ